MSKQSGQMGLGQLLMIGGSILVAVITGFFGQSSRTDAKMENFKAQVAEERVGYTADISSIKTNIENMKGSLDRIEKKLK